MPSFSDLLKKVETVHQEKPSLSDTSRHPIQHRQAISWSAEQERFLSAEAPRLLLTALAGSGKTAVLLEYARRRPHQKWNFVAFNQSVVQEVKKIAPSNVKVYTAHQLAFAQFGHDLHHKLIEQEQKEKDLFNVLPKFLIEGIPETEIKIWAEHFFNSWRYFLNSSKTLIDLTFPESYLYPQKLKKALEWLWLESLNPASSLKINHDVYLKRFCLLEKPWLGECWMLDEAQDWPESFLDAWDRLTQRSIRTGDPFQRLYGWRGASSKHWHRTNEQEYPLTQSYRTGTGVEQYIQNVLNKIHPGTSLQWKGNPHYTSVVCHDPQTIESILSFSPTVIIGYHWSDLEKLYRQVEQYIKEQKAPYQLKWHPSSPYFKESQIKLSDDQKIKTIEWMSIHQTKGLSFDRVWMIDDAIDKHHNEKNQLLYVALTRSRYATRIHPSMLIKPEEFKKMSSSSHLFEENNDDTLDFFFNQI